MNQTHTHLGVFAKYWTPGDVKTRLGAEIGNDRAALLHRDFLQTTLQRMTGLARRQELCCWPAKDHQEFSEVLSPGWELTFQMGRDLGERIEAFFDRAFESGSRHVVLLGADTPGVPIDYLQLAFESLVRSRVVLGPCPDGGYYLVGATDATPPIFRQIAWSTPQVWDQTVAALVTAGLRQERDFDLTPAYCDIDTLDDLVAFRHQLKSCNHCDASLTRLAVTIDEILASGQK